MSILIDEKTQIIVQAITGRQGHFHTARMIEYGTRIVGGVTPGKGGTFALDVPVYDTVAEATSSHRVDATIIFVPARFAAESIMEAADANVPLICCISEHIPVHDMIRVREYIRQRGCRLLGPNCPGVISPGKSKMGIMPNHLFQPGATGIVSRSGTLTYEVAYALTARGIGQSTVVGIGGDPINGTSFTEILHMFQEDPGTKSVIVIGEIGGTAEQEAASYIQDHMDIPAYGFIAGLAAPEGKRMGHAGAIVTGGSGTSAADKIAMFQDSGIQVANHPEQLADLVQNVF